MASGEGPAPGGWEIFFPQVPRHPSSVSQSGAFPCSLVLLTAVACCDLCGLLLPLSECQAVVVVANEQLGWYYSPLAPRVGLVGAQQHVFQNAFRGQL